MRTINKTTVILLFPTVALLLISCAAFAAGKSRTRVIVSPVTDKSVPSSRRVRVESAAEMIRTALKDALFKSGKFELIAEGELQQELDANRWQQYASGDFDPTLAAEIGSKVGAQQLIKCTIVTNEFWTEEKNILLAKQVESLMRLEVAVEVCDIAKATICLIDRAQSQKSSKAAVVTVTEAGNRPVTLSDTKDVRAQAIQDVVNQLVAAVMREQGAGTVIDVKGNTIVISIGSTAGAKVGDKITILGQDEFGFEEEIGTGEVTATLPDKSKATVHHSKRALVKGDAVRIASVETAEVVTPKDETVSEDAVTVVIAAGEGTSKDAAINAALLQAIQMVGGVYIMSEQEARNYQMVKNEIFSRTDGFVTKYEEISTTSNDDGTVTAVVKAWVSSKPVYDSLRAKQVLARKRVMVCVPETHLKLVVPDPAGETEIIKRLLDKNFVVVDQKISEEIKKDQVKRELLATGDAEKVIALLGNKRSAEILIYGEAFSAGAQRQSVGGATKWTCEARIEVRAVNLDTAQILWADSAHVVGTGATEEVAGKAALKAAAKLLCDGKDGEKGFVDKLIEKIVDTADTNKSIQCQIIGLTSLEDLMAVEDALREAISNRPLYRYSYENGVAVVNLESPRTAQDLADAIGKLTMKGKLTVTASYPNRIELAYSK